MVPLLPIDLKVPASGTRRRQCDVFDQLRDAIVSGRLRAGFKLPSTRALDLRPPTIATEALTHFIAEGHLARHVRRMTRLYQSRWDALASGVLKWLAGAIDPIPSAAGLHISARVDPGIPARQTGLRRP